MQIAILLYPGMTALDAIGPYEIFRFISNVDLRFVSEQPGPIVTDSGILVLGATHTYEETPAPDLLLVPGSEASTATAMADAKIVDWLRDAHKTTTYTLSVCSGALVLAAAGLLEGHRATTHWIAQQQLRRFGARPQIDKRVVQSGKIVTAAGVSAGIDLALFVVNKLYGRERAETIQLMIEYDPQPDFHAGHPSIASEEVFALARKEMSERSKNRRNMISVPLVLWRKAIWKVRTKLYRAQYRD